MRGPPRAETGTVVVGAVVGTSIVVVVGVPAVVDVVAGVEVDDGFVVDEVDGLLDELLQALSPMSRAMVAVGASRRRRTQ